MNIPDEAAEAAANAISECSGMRFDGFWSRVEDLEPEDREYALMEARAAISAALPHVLAEQQAKLDAVTKLAEQWHARGEHDMAFSKTIADEDISIAILTDGASMVENARHIRNALDSGKPA